MKRVKKIFLWTVIPLLVAYVFICAFLYFTQEKIIFRPTKLAESHVFEFEQDFEEIEIPTPNDYTLNGLHFKVDSAKGVVLFLHGNGGNIENWAPIRSYYADLGYDVILPDYKGYGKNNGRYHSLNQFLSDANATYNYTKQNYDESKITIVGYSLGTSVASYVASENNAKRLILMAPFYSFKDLMKQSYPFVPTFVLKYNIKTFEYLSKTTSPITIFQGEDDAFLTSAIKLKEHLKSTDEFVLLSNQGHNGMHSNKKFQTKLKELLTIDVE